MSNRNKVSINKKMYSKFKIKRNWSVVSSFNLDVHPKMISSTLRENISNTREGRLKIKKWILDENKRKKRNS